MKLSQFIKDNRAALDSAIDRAMGTRDDSRAMRKRNDRERQEWILNDEGLYRWARSSGCRI